MYEKTKESHLGRRVEWLDMLKGIAIILVVFRHVMQANITDSDTNIIGNCIFAIQMPVFMLIFGYFAITAPKYYENINNVLSYIARRAVRYMLPFLSWFVLIYVLLLGKYDRNILDALKALINNVDVGLWFLYVIFVLSLVQIFAIWICSKIFLNRYLRDIISVILSGMLLTPLLALGLKTGMRFLGINLIMYYYVFFALGHLVFCCSDIIKKILGRKNTQILVFIVSNIVFLAICLNFNVANSTDSIIDIFFRVVSAISGSLSIAILTYWMSSVKGKFNNILKFIGKYTLEIYVTHLYFIGLLKKKVYYFFTFQGLGVFILALVITVVLTLVTIWIIKKVWPLDFILYGKIPKMRVSTNEQRNK